MTCEDSKPLFAEYFNGTLGQEERTALQQHLEGCESCSREAGRLEILWRGLASVPTEEPGLGMRDRFYETLSAYRAGAALHDVTAPRRAGKIQHPAWRIAAGIALLLGGAGIGYGVGYGLRSNQTSGAEITQLRGEVGNMRQLVTLSLLQQQSASERLRGVSWAYRAEPSDTEVLTALLAAVNHDPNVNVRLAAVDALRTFAASRSTRDAVVQALPGQSEPIVQVALIDLLVDLKETAAAQELKRVVSDGSANSGVRQRAEWALQRLQ